MAKKAHWMCDCGCSISYDGEDAPGWVTVVQSAALPEGREVKIEYTLHFAKVSCLISWCQRVEKVMPRLKERAQCVRGWVREDELPGICF